MLGVCYTFSGQGLAQVTHINLTMSDQKIGTAVTLEEFITSDNDPKPGQDNPEIQTSYMELAAEPVEGVEGAATYVEMAPSGDETVYVTEHLPEGYTMVLGDDGQQYVTIVQDNQTYAIPLAGDYTLGIILKLRNARRAGGKGACLGICFIIIHDRSVT